MKMEEVNKLDKVNMAKKIDELKAQVFEMRFQKQTSGITQPHLLRSMRKDIARLSTALNQLQDKSE